MKALAISARSKALVPLETWERLSSRMPYQFGEAYDRLRNAVSAAVLEVWKERQEFPESAQRS